MKFEIDEKVLIKNLQIKNQNRLPGKDIKVLSGCIPRSKREDTGSAHIE